jgi:hypothetical protein
MKPHNVLLACALGAASLLGATAPASAAHVSVGAVRPAATGRLLPGNRYYGTAYRGYPYRYGYGNPYRYGYGYPYRYGYAYPYGYGLGVSVGYGGAGYGYGGAGYGYGGAGYGYVGGGYGYAAYPAAYGPRVYRARRPYWRPYRRAYLGRPIVR